MKRPPAGVIPECLGSPEDPLWLDVALVRALFVEFGLELDLGPWDWERLEVLPYYERFGLFRRHFCLQCGFASPEDPRRVDFAGARSAGIDVQSLVRYRAGIMGKVLL